MEEKVINAIFKDRKAFEQVKDTIDSTQEAVFSDINSILYDRAAEYYDRDSEASYIDLDIIRSYVAREYPRHAEIINVALDQIEREDTSCENVVDEFTRVRLHSLGQQIAQAIIAQQDPRDIITRYMDIYNGVEEDTVEHILPDAPAYADIANVLSGDNLIELYPQDLQDRTGGCMRGHHILIFARPETGKSLFTINMVRGFLAQGLKVLYIGNEDSAAAMIPRFFCSMLNVTKDDLMEMSEDEVNEGIHQAGNDGFRFVHLEPGTFPQIRGLCRVMQPDVLVVDQIRNVQTGGDGLTTSLERAGTEMRNISAEYDLLAVSVTQAGESASGKLVLGLSDIDSSKTGLPAQIDLMIGIGVDDNYEGLGKRMISLPKNKISGDHSFFSVNVDPSRSRVL
jgi:hypothetical protein